MQTATNAASETKEARRAARQAAAESREFVETMYRKQDWRVCALNGWLLGLDKKRGDIFFRVNGVVGKRWMPAAKFLQYLTAEERAVIEALPELDNWGDLSNDSYTNRCAAHYAAHLAIWRYRGWEIRRDPHDGGIIGF